MPSIADIRNQYPQYKDMSDQQLADSLHSKYYSDIPKEDYYKKVGVTPSEEGGWKSFGKGVLSSIVEVPSNVANTYATASSVPDYIKALTPLHFTPKMKPEDVKDNVFDKTSRDLQENNIANTMGQVVGDVGIGIAGGGAAGALGKGATSFGGKVLGDAAAGAVAGGLTGGPEGAALGGVSGGLLGTLGRGLGIGKYDPTTKTKYKATPSGEMQYKGTVTVPPKAHPTISQDLKSAFRDPLMWGAGTLGYAASNAVPGIGVALATYPAIKLARAIVPHIPKGSVLLKNTVSGGSGLGGGLLNKMKSNK